MLDVDAPPERLRDIDPVDDRARNDDTAFHDHAAEDRSGASGA